MSQSPARTAGPVIIRPSFRLVRPLYTLTFVALAAVYGWNNNRPDPHQWFFIVPALLLLWAIRQHVRQRFTAVTVGNGKLRYSSGLLSKTIRTMDLGKVQDVRVDQSVLQRLFGIGDLGVESAGESGGLVIRNVDRPQAVAEYILESAGR